MILDSIDRSSRRTRRLVERMALDGSPLPNRLKAEASDKQSHVNVGDGEISVRGDGDGDGDGVAGAGAGANENAMHSLVDAMSAVTLEVKHKEVATLVSTTRFVEYTEEAAMSPSTDSSPLPSMSALPTPLHRHGISVASPYSVAEDNPFDAIDMGASHSKLHASPVLGPERMSSSDDKTSVHMDSGASPCPANRGDDDDDDTTLRLNPKAISAPMIRNEDIPGLSIAIYEDATLDIPGAFLATSHSEHGAPHGGGTLPLPGVSDYFDKENVPPPEYIQPLRPTDTAHVVEPLPAIHSPAPAMEEHMEVEDTVRPPNVTVSTPDIPELDTDEIGRSDHSETSGTPAASNDEHDARGRSRSRTPGVPPLRGHGKSVRLSLIDESHTQTHSSENPKKVFYKASTNKSSSNSTIDRLYMGLPTEGAANRRASAGSLRPKWKHHEITEKKSLTGFTIPHAPRTTVFDVKTEPEDTIARTRGSSVQPVIPDRVSSKGHKKHESAPGIKPRFRV